MNANRMAEKWLETTEEANNWKRNNAEKIAEKQRMETTEEGNIRRKKWLKRWVKIKV